MSNVQKQFGAGLSLRPEHLSDWDDHPAIGFAELLFDWLREAEAAQVDRMLEAVGSRPIALHCVGLSPCGTDPLDRTYIHDLREWCERLCPAIVSDHFAWTSLDRVHYHDLLPVPFTGDIAHHVSDRVSAIQNLLGRQVALENATTYVRFKESEITELEFVTIVAERSNCGLLVDANNIYVNEQNLGVDRNIWLEGIHELKDRVVQYHVAGHELVDGRLIDSHGASVTEEVWMILEQLIEQTGPRYVTLERDNNPCSFFELVSELDRVDSILRREMATK